MFDIQTYLAAKSGKLLANPDMDMFSYLLGKSQASPTKTITGTPPFTFKSNGDNLVDWSIKGNPGGVGERTKNQLEIAVETQTIEGITWTINKESGTITASGKASSNTNTLKLYIPVSSSDRYLYFSGCPSNSTGNLDWQIIVWDETASARCTKWDGTSSTLQTEITNRNSGISHSVECLIPANHVCRMNLRFFNTTETYSGIVFYPMLREANTSADFIPYGYEIPVTCGGVTTDIFIGDTPLGADDTITKTSTGVDIPTVNGNNTLTVDTTVQPSEMTITYHR